MYSSGLMVSDPTSTTCAPWGMFLFAISLVGSSSFNPLTNTMSALEINAATLGLGS